MTPTHTHTHTHAQRTGKLFNEKFPDSDDVQYVQPPSPSSPFFFYLSMDVRNSTVANSPRIQEIERERERERELVKKWRHRNWRGKSSTFNADVTHKNNSQKKKKRRKKEEKKDGR